jgi:hypothetical protein
LSSKVSATTSRSGRLLSEQSAQHAPVIDHSHFRELLRGLEPSSAVGSRRSQDLSDASVRVCRAADQLEALWLGQAVHQGEPRAERYRMHSQAVLVDEAASDQAVCDACAAEDDYVPAGLALELRDLLFEGAPREARIIPVDG